MCLIFPRLLKHIQLFRSVFGFSNIFSMYRTTCDPTPDGTATQSDAVRQFLAALSSGGRGITPKRLHGPPPKNAHVLSLQTSCPSLPTGYPKASPVGLPVVKSAGVRRQEADGRSMAEILSRMLVGMSWDWWGCRLKGNLDQFLSH